MFKIEKFTFNIFSVNTYLLWNSDSKTGCVIDPGCSNMDEENMLSTFIENNEIRIKYLINTHCHIDHILGNDFIKEKYNSVFLAPEKEVFLIDMMDEQAGLFGIDYKLSPNPDNFINTGYELDLDGIENKFLFTPGHSPGEYSVYFPNDKICICGDVIFKEGIGRYDLWGADYNDLINSINTEILSLPDETVLYPGHGPETTVGYEKQNNPFLT